MILLVLFLTPSHNFSLIKASRLTLAAVSLELIINAAVCDAAVYKQKHKQHSAAKRLNPRSGRSQR